MAESKEFEEVKLALKDIGHFIKVGRQKLVQDSPQEIVEKIIPDSTSELEAIISGAETATNEIMDACDKIGILGSEMDEEKQALLQAEISKIYAACGFQDITGQRATKVISYLSRVEAKSLNLIKHLKDFFDKDGSLTSELEQQQAVEPAPAEEETLANGPQLEGEGLSQDDVDALLNDF